MSDLVPASRLTGKCAACGWPVSGMSSRAVRAALIDHYERRALEGDPPHVVEPADVVAVPR